MLCVRCTHIMKHVFINKSKMLVVGQKRKHVHKILREKALALKDIEKGLSNKKVAAKYSVPKIPYLNGSKIKTKSCHH